MRERYQFAAPGATGRYEIVAAGAGKPAELLIYGDIGASWWDDESNTAKQVVGKLAEIDAAEIHLRINSAGGVVSDALAIFNALRRHSARVVGFVDGVAYSAASLIAMAADELRMADNAMLMIHAPWGAGVGNAQELRRAADMLDKHAEAMSAAYARGGRMTREAALALLTDGEDHYYTADEALSAGLIEAIEPADMPIAAKLRDFGTGLARYRVPRASDDSKTPARRADNQEADMPETKTAAGAETPAEQQTPADNVVAIQDAATRAERKRIAARNAELAPVFARFPHDPEIQALHREILADPDVSVDQARAKLLDKIGEGSEPLAGAPDIRGGLDARDKARAGMRDAILMRVGALAHDGANEFRGLKLHEMARACLAAINYPGASRLSPEELAPLALTWGPVRGAQTTSDFPILLEEAMHKLVLRGFAAIEPAYQRFCKIGDVSDFRSWNRLVPGLIGNLDGVNEHGEYRDKVIPDAVKNAISATRKGNIFSLTPEVLINDDTGQINDMAFALGAAGPRTIDRAVFALIEANPTMSDGYALFSTDHGNLAGTGVVPSVAAIEAARVAMAAQTAPGADAEILDIRPAIAVGPTALGGQLRVINDAQYDPDTANKLQRPNMVRGLFRDIVDSPRLSSAIAYYLFADPMLAPVIEVVFLNGQREPRIVQEEAFRTGGLSWRVEMPFGVGAIDFRGAYKQPGTAG